MSFAYGWALSKPVRKIYYNLIVTGLSVAVAFVIGTIEVLSLFSQSPSGHGAFLSWTSAIDLNNLGFAIVGLFVATWIVSVAIWKFGRIEEKWAPARSHTFSKGE